MLLPALSQAREKARTITCLSNQKQIGTFIGMYTNDYNEWFPMQIGSKEGFRFTPTNQENPNSYYTFATWGRILLTAGYISKREKFLQCTKQQIPADANNTLYEYTYGMNGDGRWHSVNYAAKNAPESNRGGRFHWRGSDIGMKDAETKLLRPAHAPTDFVMLACTRGNGSKGQKAAIVQGLGGCNLIFGSTTDARYWACHNKQTNVLYPDLHAGSNNASVMYTQVATTIKFWYGNEQ